MPDTKEGLVNAVGKLAATLGPQGFLALACLAALVWMHHLNTTRSSAQADRILEHEIQIEQHVEPLHDAIMGADDRAAARFRDWQTLQREELEALRRMRRDELNTIRGGFSNLSAWMRASCYASANGDETARLYCDRVGTHD